VGAHCKKIGKTTLSKATTAPEQTINKNRHPWRSLSNVTHRCSLNASAFRAASTIAGKSRAKRIAVDRPIPWLAPVIIATELTMSPFSPCIG